MSFVSRAGDLFYAFRFLKLLVTPFERTKAFELGIIDDKGKVLKRAKDRQKPNEKAAYTVFHRLVFNLKRLIGKVPGGRSVVARYGAALFLIKEHTKMSDEKMLEMLGQALDMDINPYELNENKWYQDPDSNLYPGNYILTEDIASPITGEVIGLKPVSPLLALGLFLENELLDTPGLEVNGLRREFWFVLKVGFCIETLTIELSFPPFRKIRIASLAAIKAFSNALMRF